MRRTIYMPLLLGGLLLLAGSCASSKKAAKDTTAGEGLPRDLVAISKAVEPASAAESKKVTDAVAAAYASWHSVQLDGKMSMKGLPVDPSARIYMERGTQLLISVRAPILGEVARIEVADGEVLMANRMKKLYARENLDRFLSRVDMSVEDVQDIFLGRVFILGQGQLDGSNARMLTVTSAPSGSWILTPRKQPAQAEYGFTLTADLLLQILFAQSADGRYSAQAEYEWKGTDGRKDVDLTITADDKKYSPRFSFRAPDFSPRPMARFSPGKGWKQVSLKEFMSSI